jgi:hypothetical protein
MAPSLRILLPAGFALASVCLAASVAMSGASDQAKVEARRFIEGRFTVVISFFSREQPENTYVLKKADRVVRTAGEAAPAH